MKINVTRLREALGESQAEFGRRFGVDQSTVSRWEDRYESGKGLKGPIAILLKQLERERLGRKSPQRYTHSAAE